MDQHVQVLLKRDSIQVINDGSLSGKKGEIIEEGQLLQHISGKWIIGTNEDDKFAAEVGGCSEGPLEIYLEERKLWLC